MRCGLRGGSGDPAGGTGREGGTVDLRGTARVYPIEDVGVLCGPEFFVYFFVNGLTERFLDFHVPPVRKLGGVSPGFSQRSR